MAPRLSHLYKTELFTVKTSLLITSCIRYSSALHLLARLQRTRSFGRLPYEDLAPEVLMKTSFQRAFDPKSSQG